MMRRRGARIELRTRPVQNPWRPVWMAGLMLPIAMSGLAQAGYGADPHALMAQGKAAYHAGDLGQAWVTFQQAAALAPPSAAPALWLGAVAVARGDRTEAETWFREALDRHPSLPEASCAAEWLRLLGIMVSRPRWHLSSPEEYATFVRAVNPTLTLEQAHRLGAAVPSAAAGYGIDPRLLAAVVFVESRFKHTAVSSSGAQGLGQLMPGTAAALGVDPRDPLQNLRGAAWLLRLHLDAFSTPALALAAYNAGGPAVRRWGGIPPYAETRWYVWAVLWVYDGLRG